MGSAHGEAPRSHGLSQPNNFSSRTAGHFDRFNRTALRTFARLYSP